MAERDRRLRHGRSCAERHSQRGGAEKVVLSMSKDDLAAGGRLIFPLPDLEVVGY